MAGLFTFLFLISLIILVVGLIFPSLFKKFLGERATRKGVGTIFGIAALVFFVLIGVTAEPNNKENNKKSEAQEQEKSESKKPEAVSYKVAWEDDISTQLGGEKVKRMKYGLVVGNDIKEEQMTNCKKSC